MIGTLKLLIPALLPSWRFFDTIGPSPRIQFTVLSSESETPSQWQEFRPRPATLSLAQMLRRMLWNPSWNESLFLTSCAERLCQQPTPHSEDEILKRIRKGLLTENSQHSIGDATYLQFRLVLVKRDSAHPQQVSFQSRIEPLRSRA